MSHRHRMTREQTRRCAAFCFLMIVMVPFALFFLALAAGHADSIPNNPNYVFLFLFVFFGILFGSGARKPADEEEEEEEE
jgi:hypothetical protein